MFDVAAGSAGLLLAAPVMALTAAAVWKDMGRPVIFKQKRGGYGGRVFEVLKFRTMKNATDASGQHLPDSKRLTPLGKFLRASSLDELPQLWNVVRGDMSIVGPRPFIAQYLPLYNARQRRRHEVRPGITGWAQINGRNGLSWEERFELDVWYVDHWSHLLDAKILVRTVGALVRRRGINAGADVTMSLFQG